MTITDIVRWRSPAQVWVDALNEHADHLRFWAHAVRTPWATLLAWLRCAP